MGRAASGSGHRAHKYVYWTYQTAPGRTAGVVETKDVDLGGTAPSNEPAHDESIGVP